MFFVLKEDASGYGMEGRIPQGRCVIEARGGSGKVLIYVQDLKPQVAYKAILIKRGSDRSIGTYLGLLEVGANRRAEMNYEINPDDVGGSGLPIEDFDTVSITLNDGRLVFLLSGSNAGDNRWKNNLEFGIRNEELKNEEIKTEVQAVEPFREEETLLEEQPSPKEEFSIEEQSFPEEEPSPEEQARILPFVKLASAEDYDPHLAFKETIQRLNMELTELAEITSASEDGQNEEPGTYQDPDNTSAIEDEFTEIHSAETIPERHDSMSPFENDTAVWKKITLRELALLPIDVFDYEQKAIVAASFYRHGHLILGNAPDDSQADYTVGVPGIYSSDDGRSFQKLGFGTFRGKQGESGPGAEGYWLKELSNK